MTGKQCLIETHSDYLVDRIRMEVRGGKVLKPEDVSLLYFERADGDVRIHSLEIDRMGNIVNAPKGYRQFFLEEEKRLLGG
jgi:predicted ATPase